MKVLIIEDEAPAFRRLEKILTEIDPEIELLEVFDSIEDTVKWMKNHKMPDLAFMDIQISDGLSFRIFDEVKVECPVIFTTAFDEYLLQAFKVNSIDYLLKPIKKEELERALNKYKGFKNTLGGNSTTFDINELIQNISLSEAKYKSRFLVKQGEKMLAIKTEDITCFHSKNGIVYINTCHKKKYLTDFTLDELNLQLDPRNFYRANRQFIVNANFINSVEKYYKGKLLVEVLHFSDDSIVVSTEKATSFKNWLDQ